jgi:hypothetical protein
MCTKVFAEKEIVWLGRIDQDAAGQFYVQPGDFSPLSSPDDYELITSLAQSKSIGRSSLRLPNPSVIPWKPRQTPQIFGSP